MARQHLVKYDPECMHVGLWPDRADLAPRLLGSHVGRSAQDRVAASFVRALLERISLQQLGQAEVRDFGNQFRSAGLIVP